MRGRAQVHNELTLPISFIQTNPQRMGSNTRSQQHNCQYRDSNLAKSVPTSFPHMIGVMGAPGRDLFRQAPGYERAVLGLLGRDVVTMALFLCSGATKLIAESLNPVLQGA